MKNIFVGLLWVLCSGQAASIRSDVFSQEFWGEVQVALSVLEELDSSVGTDSFNEDIHILSQELLSFVGYAKSHHLHTSLTLKGLDCAKHSRRFDSWFSGALAENRALKRPLPLIPGRELECSLSHMSRVVSFIVRVYIFSQNMNQCSWLKSKLQHFTQEAEAHISAIIETPPVQYLMEYFTGERDSWQTLIGSNEGQALEAESYCLVESLCQTFQSIHFDSFLWKSPSCSKLLSFIKEVRSCLWKETLDRYVAYAQVDKVFPGILSVWEGEGDIGAKDARRFLQQAQEYLCNESLEEKSEWGSYDFDYESDLREEDALSIEKALAGLELLAPLYSQREHASHEKILLLLAAKTNPNVQKVQRKELIDNILPSFAQVMMKFSTLSREEVQRVLLAFCKERRAIA